MGIQIGPGDVLLGIAALAVAFTGFSSIVAVFQSQSARRAAAFDQFRFWVMLEFSLGALLFALLPFPLHFFGLSPETVWAASSFAMAAFIVAQALVIGRLIRMKIQPVVTSMTPLITALAVCVNLAVFCTQLLNGLGIVFERSFAAYLLGLLLVLLAASVNFVRLVWVGKLEGSES